MKLEDFERREEILVEKRGRKKRVSESVNSSKIYKITLTLV